MPRQSTRIKKTRETQVSKVARQIDLASPHLTDYELADRIAYSSKDASAALRSGEKQTLRRTTKIDQLHKRGIIGPREAKACDWYKETHAARYDTVGTTARYGESSGGGCTNFDHLPKTRQQVDAFYQFTAARGALCPVALPLFEAVVIHDRPLGQGRKAEKTAIIVRETAQKLLEHVEGRHSL